MPTTSETKSGRPIHDHQVFTLAAHILFASFGQGGVIFNLDTRESHQLNPSGASVIGLCDGRCNVSAIVDSLSRENGVVPEVIKADVTCFLKDILNRGWIDDR